ncbi:hypothetical protein HPB49_003707 [Dermacentor silvarum]|uniref:Uncharacterized protein n=1 Tax=Dermacentor silvarum TaxID=543639 RepID=A0ACB8DTV3_DERSI|nr:protein max [Dermacentor silvarum]KAH7977830.1 hypothetical protein HPB49_003707 [Dermacentor silvarum]
MSDGKTDKRARHSALERCRRDRITSSFSSLRDAVPSLQGEKATRSQILKKAADYIESMLSKNNDNQRDIQKLWAQNKLLEEKIRMREEAKMAACSRERSGWALHKAAAAPKQGE